MRLRDATKEDLDYMFEHSTNTSADRTPIENVHRIFVMEDEDVLVMAGGFQFITPTTAWCWLDTSEDFKKNVISAYRTIKEWIDVFIETNRIKRLQAFVRCDFTEAVRMMEHLGFERESLMKKFLGDDDAYMYVRVI